MKGFAVKIVQTVVFSSKRSHSISVHKVIAILNDDHVLKSGVEYENELKLQVIIVFYLHLVRICFWHAVVRFRKNSRTRLTIL